MGFAEGHRVKIRIEVAPPVDEVRADADRLAQVISNLLSNAVKCSPPDNEVVVSIENGVDLVRISVRDHGPGISPEFKSRVFERFAQADATNARRNGGTGLGLSIVKEIVDRLAGEVGFGDAPGGGAIFHVELPIWADLTRDQRIQAALAESPETALENLAAVSSRLALAPARAAKGAV
jgi:signal transduction histidine kinase